jgi:hypothetical protein
MVYAARDQRLTMSGGCLRSLLYISESTLPRDVVNEALLELAESSARRAAELGVTGAMVFTQDHFAELLEGSSESVQAMMHERLEAPHHRRVSIIDVVHIPAPRFQSWELAYAGASRYLDRRISAVFEKWTDERAATLRELMEAFGEKVA